MAWTGSATVTQISDNKVRITGLSLAADASGTIGFADKTVAADVSIPKLPNWQPYKANGVSVTLQDAVSVEIVPVTDVSAAVPISVVKSGTTHADFAITFHNDNAGGGQVSAGLEIYVSFHQ